MKLSRTFRYLPAIAISLAMPGPAQSATGLELKLHAGLPIVSISAPTGTLCQVQFLDELWSSNWISLTNFALTTSPSLIIDAGSGGSGQRFYRAMAVPPNLASVPGGSFDMGDSFGDLGADEVPVHAATVSGFYMDRMEVSKALWEIVYSWATNHGYDFSASVGVAKAANHPVSYVRWYDAVKWCNARSEMEGFTPCYYLEDSQSSVYRAGQVSVSNSFVNWSANGYRLPTEAEWERAARGGAARMRFPWAETNVISHARANYVSGDYYAYDKSPTTGYHPAFTNGAGPYTSPCGYFAANGFGLYDMAGNVWEWCWDWHDPYWYTNSAASSSDTRGPEGVSSGRRVRRGGSFASNAPDCCCALREGAQPTSTAGFRCVKRATAADLVVIPAGSFEMGDTFIEGSTNELPLHTVYLSAFYVGRCEVTKDLWDSVYAWATNHGYEFENSGQGKAGDHPVQSINWYDALRWCNARSEMEGLTPCYYLDTSLDVAYVYRSSLEAALWTNFVKWNANGYRLPTEAEWEKAARGGLAATRFPWGDTITHTQANYYSVSTYAYDVSATRNYNPWYNTGGFPYSNPVADFPANGYGLCGTADNVSEWCWDWYDSSWYSQTGATNRNCLGPRGDGLAYRVRRGGSWNVYPNKVRTAFRDYSAPEYGVYYIGFRCARGL